MRLSMLIILGTLAPTSFFLAQGATSLAAAKFLPATDAQVAPVAAAKAELPGSSPPDPKDILKRNVFDPETGPLWPPPPPEDPTATTEATDEPVQQLMPGQMPPPCDKALKLVATMHAVAAPEASFATIGSGSDPPLLYRIGGQVGDRQVAEIFPKAVFLSGGGHLCSLTMFAEASAESAATTPKPAAASSVASAAKTAATVTKGRGAISDDDMDKGIQKNSDSQFTVQRSLVDKVLENQAAIMRSARIVPHEQGGQVVGVKLYGIRRNSLLGRLGLQNGDLLRTINGFSMASPDSALEAYSKLRSANNLSLAVTRRGSPLNVEYQIQ
jgi:general secretion pathway protein C